MSGHSKSGGEAAPPPGTAASGTGTAASGSPGTAASGAGTAASALARLGFAQGHVVQELGWDEDADETLRDGIELLTGTPIEDEEYGEGADGVLIWYRDGDGDLADLLLDGIGQLYDSGYLVIATPRTGTPGAVEASDLEEAASGAGLVVGAPVKVSPDWACVKVVPPRGTHPAR